MVVAARPENIIDFETDDVEHEQEGTAGVAVKGEYTAVDAQGNEYTIKYIADHLGFRVVDDEDALPEFRDAKPDGMFVEEQHENLLEEEEDDD